MAYVAIAGIAPQYENYPNWWLKAYEQGTTTPLAMALDADGVTTVSKLVLDLNGFINTDGNAKVIPYLDEAYDLWLIPTEADANANDLTNAVQVADNIDNIIRTVSFANYDDLRAVGNASLVDGQVITVTDEGIAGQGVLRNVVGHGVTDNGGTIIVIDANWYWERIYSGAVHAKWFGLHLDGSNVTANNTILESIKDYVISFPIGARPSIILPEGNIAFSVSPNWGHSDISIEGQGSGSTRLSYSGAGSAVEVDPSAFDVSFRYGIKLQGFLIDCGSNGTAGVYFENISHTLVKDVFAINGGATCVHFDNRLAVLCHFETCGSPISRYTPSSIHQESVRLGTSPSRGLPSTANVFTNFIAEGASLAGIRLLDSTNNTFIGGTSESNTGRGVLISSTSRNNTFVGVDMEANTLVDLRDEGQSTKLDNCFCTSYAGVEIAGLSKGTKLVGGIYHDITVESGAKAVVIRDLQINFHGSGGTISDLGNATQIKQIIDRATGLLTYFHRARQTVAVTASPMVFTNNTGEDVQLLIKGGTITQVLWGRGGDYTPIGLVADGTPVNGLFPMKPEDSITISYTAAPSIVNYIPMGV